MALLAVQVAVPNETYLAVGMEVRRTVPLDPRKRRSLPVVFRGGGNHSYWVFVLKDWYGNMGTVGGSLREDALRSYRRKKLASLHLVTFLLVRATCNASLGRARPVLLWLFKM